MQKGNLTVALRSMAILVALTFVLAGCKSKKPTDLDTGADSGSTTEQTSGDGLPNLDLENLLFTPGSEYGLNPVYFDFDSFTLRPDALATLSDNAEKIKKVPNVIIQVAGHCDERGTQEYNLALGEKRALSVREHLIQLGVSGDRLITLSFGEESPAVPGTGESAWSKNRRCEFNRAQ